MCNQLGFPTSNNQMKKQEDLIYIDRILSGNADAFRFLVEKYKDMVFTIIVKIVGNEADAEELAQDVFLKVYHSLNRFQRKSKFSTWIYRIAYNTAISKTRKKKLTTEMLNDHVLDNYTDDEIHENIYRLSPEQQKKFADKALETLPEEEYLIITLYHKEECSIKEISEIVSLKESNVKVKLHRIRKKLHQKIDALMQEHLITR